MQDSPLKIALVYTIAGVLWILFSDWLLRFMVDDPLIFARVATAKGWVFIGITALVLYWLISADQREIVRSAEALREREGMLRNVLDTLPVGVWLLDREGTVTYGNHAGQKIWEGTFFVGIDQFHVYKGWSLATGELIGAREWGGARAILAGETSLAEEIEIETFNGVRKIILHSAVPLRDRQDVIVGAIVVNEDITARKRMERENDSYQERLRSMASEMSLVEERERRQLATALHDQVGQVLALAKIRLGEMRESGSLDACRCLSEEVRQLLEQAIGTSRSLTFELSPPVLFELGFEPALRALCENFQQQYDLRFEFADDRQPKPLADDMRILLFRAVRELLVNIVKHARAASCRVSCERDDGRILIVVADNGCGFEPTAQSAHSPDSLGFGLFSIRERLHYLGGGMTIESSPGQGTTVILAAPLQENDREEISP